MRDIKPIIDMNDYSLYWFLATLIFGIFIGYKLYKKFYKIGKKSCKIDCEKYYFVQFSNIDWSKPKEAAYLATRYGEVLAKDRRRKELFEQMRKRLDSYKYKKDSDKVDTETLNYYNLYKKVCDESI